MAQELYYTSAPKGLKPGTSGFCTVAATDGLAASIMQRLENLSAYEMLFKVGSPEIDKNPPMFAHWRPSMGSHMKSVLSHVKFSGMDHNGRTNKFAHHVVLGPDEAPNAGPAWLMLQDDFIASHWTGEPRLLKTEKSIPSGAQPPRICKAWEKASGDAAWAGVLVEKFLTDGSKPSYVIYPLGMDVLELVDEAIALMPPADRWRVTFCTYFTKLPADLSCDWRFCVEGSPAVKTAQAAKVTGSLVIDLTGPRQAAPSTRYGQLARTAEGAPVGVSKPTNRYIPKSQLPPEPTPLGQLDVDALERGVIEVATPASTSAPTDPAAAAARAAAAAAAAAARQAKAAAPAAKSDNASSGGIPIYFWVIALAWPVLVLLFGWFVMQSQLANRESDEVRDLQAKVSTLSDELEKAKKEAAVVRPPPKKNGPSATPPAAPDQDH